MSAQWMQASVTLTPCLGAGQQCIARRKEEKETNKEELKRHPIIDKISAYLGNIESLFKDRNNPLQQEVASTPEIIETVMAAIGIMEERITRMNLAVDRPDILIQPRLGEMKMLNFDQVAHAIEEGYKGAQEKLEDILSMIQ